MSDTLFNLDGLTPHGFCLSWRSDLFWSMAASDTAIAISYISISATIIIFMRKRKLMHFRWVGGLFAAFIMLCALSHIMDTWTLWNPDYGLQVVEKGLTAIISILTAVLLWPLLPHALAIPSAAELEAKIEDRTRDLRENNRLLLEAKDEVLESAALFRKLFYESSDGNVLHDSTGLFVDFNRAAHDLLKMTREQLCKMTPFQIAPEFQPDGRRSADAALDLIAQAHSTGFHRFEWTFLNGEGGKVIVDVSLMPITIKGQVMLYATWRDITERKEAEQKYKELNGWLARSNADLEQFAYVASHDLQTPLRNIVRYAQLLEHRYKNRLDADADVFIGFVVDSGKHMTRLINDLLEFSRVSRQSEPLKPISAGEALAQALKNLDLELVTTGAEVKVGDLPTVVADQTYLVSLFQNLLGNGLKYRAPDRKPVLSVSAERVSFDSWRFSVADNGIGIEPQYHDKIFEIFQRLDPASNAEGTGIGLTLCRRIVHRFGGNIWLKSEPGTGTTFFFSLRDGSAAA
ncbi:sensor histidine kinase [Magnetospirillum gryphiswaldense]|uniref:histidine kinase n=1 Tax=Magnetospirillum gryphiswaldense TaxID=55518 RepID=A4TZ90_9PROT|nr:ATP-binding protein [Magnetospirillum gryphiswaldense]CAM75947.1 Signal transduction histidine kinase [Magnetospirillum gryphiswaldense MSR-1]